MTRKAPTSRRLPSSRSSKLLVAAIALLASCREASCPDGQVALEGACYPADLVEAAGGQVPVVCSPACGAAAPFCDYRNGTCFACRSDDDCTDHDAPVCDPDTRACAGCEDDDACESFDEVCDVARASCVECTLDTEALQCGNKTCNLASNDCTTTELHSVATCMSCVADHDCGPYMRCVDYRWRPGDATERVCLYEKAQGGCQTALGYRAPYVAPVSATAVDGSTVQVCAPPSTCFATLTYLEQKPCVSSADCDGTARASGACIAGRCAVWCARTGNREPYVSDPCLPSDFCDSTNCVDDPDR